MERREGVLHAHVCLASFKTLRLGGLLVECCQNTSVCLLHKPVTAEYKPYACSLRQGG